MRYRSGETGLFVNSYLESEEGVVAIDSPLLLSDGRAFRARFEALRKPLLGVLLTHPHPDHYNTVTRLLAGEEAPVIALAEVEREICEQDDAKRWMLGDGDSAFVGDLAFNGTHAYLADGHTGAWLEALDRAEEVLAGVRVLYLGHGPSATPAVLAEQRRYLLMVREAIGRVAGGRAELSEEEANEVAGLIDRFLHGAPLAWLVSVGAPAVAAELARTPARA